MQIQVFTKAEGYEIEVGKMEKNTTYTLYINGMWERQGKARFINRYLRNNF
jgi:hypothetical protein